MTIMGAFSGRVRVSVPRMGVGERTATTLALVLHELATNSLKYGALSSETGTLDVSCSDDDDDIVMVWTERRAAGGKSRAARVSRSVVRQRVLSDRLAGLVAHSIPRFVAERYENRSRDDVGRKGGSELRALSIEA